MSRVPVVLVSPEDLKRMFEALGLPDKLRRGELISAVRRDDPAKAAYALGGRSRIVKHFRAHDGTHILTTHELMTPGGDKVHDHPKDTLIGQTKFAAEGEPQYDQRRTDALIRRLEELLGAPADLVSVGPKHRRASRARYHPAAVPVCPRATR